MCMLRQRQTRQTLAKYMVLQNLFIILLPIKLDALILRKRIFSFQELL